MNTRLLLTVSAATGLALTAAPATAQTTTSESGAYETVPVVEPLPPRFRDAGVDYEVAEPARPAFPAAYPETYNRTPYPTTPRQGSPAPDGYTTTPIEFDREGWLTECREQYGDGKEKGGILGSLLGAIAGGVIGNRVADSERLAGTLIGAGVGGLAGLAIGSAIGGSGDRRKTDECEATLDQYLAGGFGPQYIGYPGYGYATGGHDHGYHHSHHGHHDYAYQQPVRMIPVSVPVQQRAVIREYVTYETYTDTETTVEQPVERVRYIKERPAPTPIKRVPIPRSVKGQ